MATTLSRVISFSTPARAFSGKPCVSSNTSSIFCPFTPPASLMILAATSRPSFTCVPCDTEPGGDCAIVTPTLIGSAANVTLEKANRPAANVSRPTRRVSMGRILLGGYFSIDLSSLRGMLGDWLSPVESQIGRGGFNVAARSRSAFFAVPLRETAVVIQHRLQQHLRARRTLFFRRKFRFVVADTVMAGRENHARGRDTRDVARIMSRTRHHVAHRITRCLRGFTHAIDAFLVEVYRRLVENF